MADVPTRDIAPEEEDDVSVQRHYVLVLVVQAVMLSVMWVAGRYFSS